MDVVNFFYPGQEIVNANTHDYPQIFQLDTLNLASQIGSKDFTSLKRGCQKTQKCQPCFTKRLISINYRNIIVSGRIEEIVAGLRKIYPTEKIKKNLHW